MVEQYRGYNITYWAKPVPTRAWDYDFAHEDYDGAPDSGDHRCGNGASVEDCKEQIDERGAGSRDVNGDDNEEDNEEYYEEHEDDDDDDDDEAEEDS